MANLKSITIDNYESEVVGGLKWVKDASESLQSVVENDVENNVASGNYAHAEGTRNQIGVNAEAAHAEGFGNTITAKFCHAEGESNHALARTEHVGGMYCPIDPQWHGVVDTSTRGRYAEVIGNGTDDRHRSAGRTLDWDGNEWLAGGLILTTPDGTKKYKITIDNNGNLVTTQFTDY